jgi:hypothetical protein
MDDQSRHAATSADTDFNLTIDEVLERYARAGLPRTPRSIQRYCAKGHLDARLVETAFGEKYLITPASVDKHIAYIQEINDSTGRDTSRPFASEITPHQTRDMARQEHATSPDEPRHVAAPVASHFSEGDTTRQSPTSAPTQHDQPRQVATSDVDARYISRLESEVDFLRGQVATKDGQIKELTERSRETNVLIGGLQRMLSPLLGSPDRHQSQSPFEDRQQQ